MGELIKHAALRSRSHGMIFLGKCHSDCFSQAKNVGVKVDSWGINQGFFTDNGRFVSRSEAARIAVSNGQVKKGRLELYSEDLWSPVEGGLHDYDYITGYYKKGNL